MTAATERIQNKVAYPIAVNVAIAATLLWIGFVGAISFMEAWLKFTAPGVTLVIGLSIGKIVFAALNRVEIVLSTITLVAIISGNAFHIRRESFFLVAVAILLLQTFWVLPVLTERINMYVNGETPPQSSMHFYFIVLEASKVLLLIVYAFKLFRVRTAN
jgi:hypothetical protein